MPKLPATVTATKGKKPYTKAISDIPPYPSPIDANTIPYPQDHTLQKDASHSMYLFCAQKRLQAQLQPLHDLLPNVEGLLWNHPEALTHTYLAQAITHMQIALRLLTFTQKVPQIRDMTMNIPITQPLLIPDPLLSRHFSQSVQYSENPFVPPMTPQQIKELITNLGLPKPPLFGRSNDPSRISNELALQLSLSTVTSESSNSEILTQQNPHCPLYWRGIHDDEVPSSIPKMSDPSHAFVYHIPGSHIKQPLVIPSSSSPNLTTSLDKFQIEQWQPQINLSTSPFANLLLFLRTIEANNMLAHQHLQQATEQVSRILPTSTVDGQVNAADAQGRADLAFAYIENACELAILNQYNLAKYLLFFRVTHSELPIPATVPMNLHWVTHVPTNQSPSIILKDPNDPATAPRPMYHDTVCAQACEYSRLLGTINPNSSSLHTEPRGRFYWRGARDEDLNRLEGIPIEEHVRLLTEYIHTHYPLTDNSSSSSSNVQDATSESPFHDALVIGRISGTTIPRASPGEEDPNDYPGYTDPHDPDHRVIADIGVQTSRDQMPSSASDSSHSYISFASFNGNSDRFVTITEHLTHEQTGQGRMTFRIK
ncbi:hypothetical protein K474DRAFT_1679892 [Panus rudis PR-1116 ss-1]|nr:hypothetical protein K474DRAFT_1679892 [Panus rudis PR-1116 ss-1]